MSFRGGGGAPSGPAGGNLAGTYPNPTIAALAVTSAKLAAGAAASNLLLYDSGALGAPAASIDSGAGGFATTLRSLRIDIYARSDKAAVNQDILQMVFNGDTGNNYDVQLVFSAAGGTSASESFGRANIYTSTLLPAATTTASYFLSGTFDIPNYGDTTAFKTIVGVFNGPRAATSGNFYHCGLSGAWRSTAAISRVAISANGGNLIAGSRLTIWGL